MKTHLLKTSQGIALKIDGVVSDCKLEFGLNQENSKAYYTWLFSDSDRVECTVEMEENQCDGCKANLPLIGNVHQCSYPTGSTGCQKEKYNRPKITDGKIKVLTIKTT